MLHGKPAPAGWRGAVFTEIERQPISIKRIRTEEWKLKLSDDRPRELC
jgi:hypothetical protein